MKCSLSAGEAVFALRFDAAGQLTRFTQVRASFPEATLERVQRTLATLVEPQPAAVAWGVRLEVKALANAVELRTARSQWCPAIDRSPPQRAHDYSQVLNESRAAERVLTGTTIVEAVVDDRGAVRAARVLKPSPQKFVDSLAVRFARSGVYGPALEDGWPVFGADTLEFRVEDSVYRGVSIYFRSLRKAR